MSPLFHHESAIRLTLEPLGFDETTGPAAQKTPQHGRNFPGIEVTG
jgi:hypothetical protein